MKVVADAEEPEDSLAKRVERLENGLLAAQERLRYFNRQLGGAGFTAGQLQDALKELRALTSWGPFTIQWIGKWRIFRARLYWSIVGRTPGDRSDHAEINELLRSQLRDHGRKISPWPSRRQILKRLLLG